MSSEDHYDEMEYRAGGEVASPEEIEEHHNGAPVEADAPEATTHTARPKKAKNGSKKSSKSTPKPEEEAKPAAAPAKKANKKKPANPVNILNVMKKDPIAEGVNTPRSVELCEQNGFAPSELAPYKVEYFKGFGVSAELAELRYRSYEKRRQQHMEVVLPKRKEMAKRAKAAKQAEEAERQAQEAADAEAEANRRQFEMQARNSQMRQQQSQGEYYSMPRGSQQSALRSPTRDTVGASAATAKIQSRCKTENREPNENEAVMMEVIMEREMYRSEVRTRGYDLNDDMQRQQVENLLVKEIEAEERVHRVASDREKERERKYFERLEKEKANEERRFALEEERQRRIQDEVAERQARRSSVGGQPAAHSTATRRRSVQEYEEM